MNRFTPKLQILPPPQKRLWPELITIPKHFVLYGGTAIALRLNHRQSVDFDFFSTQPIDTDRLYSEIDLLNGSQILQQEENTLTVIVERDGPVKLSFFGRIRMGRIGIPELTDDNVLLAASMTDLLANKLKVILQRADVKDYLDIAAILKSGVSLDVGLSGAKSLWKNQPVMECLRALCYFQNGDFDSLSGEDRKLLIKSVEKINPDDLPELERFESVSNFDRESGL